ncbi:hypothetical protein [Flammeovirga pacifica]|nr:hypothetical protein [Flammeovirga pacifica]
MKLNKNLFGTIIASIVGLLLIPLLLMPVLDKKQGEKSEANPIEIGNTTK